MRCLLGSIAFVFCAPAGAQHAAHAHGMAELRVAVDGPQLLVEFDSPLDNLVGFEHAPKNAAQREALGAAERRLRKFEALFVLPPAAGCKLRDAEVSLPYGAGGAAAAKAPATAHGHADVQASYTLDCAAPEALDEMRLGLFEAFPRIRRIRAETATAKTQGAKMLERPRLVLPL